MNLDNRTIYVHDNLPVLRGIDTASVDLIATDPPFNSGRIFKGTDGQVLNDSWKWKVDYTQWMDTFPNRKVIEVVEAALHAHSRGLAAFLCFMAMRLVEMHRVLKADGTIYVQCDDRAGHYLKALMDAIWGEERFMADIVWERAKSHKMGNNWARSHDNLLVYGAGKINKEHIAIEATPEVTSNYRQEDEHGKFQPTVVIMPGQSGGDSGKPWEGIDINAEGKRWIAPVNTPEWFSQPPGFDDMTTRQKLTCYKAAGLIYWSKAGRPYFKRYLSVNKGVAPTNVWVDIKPLASNAKARRDAKHWTTQKPVPLYERIVLASSKPGDLVLDPFCGCATTCIAAEKHGRHWVGIEQSKAVVEAMTTYLRAETQTDDIFTKPRLSFTPPKRTDGGELATPAPARGKKPRKVNMPKEQWLAHRENLAKRHGTKCQGCGTVMPRLVDLELDHITPKAQHLHWNPNTPDEVINHPTNLTLLCSHCNRTKGSRMCLSDLQTLMKGGVEKEG